MWTIYSELCDVKILSGLAHLTKKVVGFLSFDIAMESFFQLLHSDGVKESGLWAKNIRRSYPTGSFKKCFFLIEKNSVLGAEKSTENGNSAI